MAANLIQISGSPKTAVAILGSDGSIMSTSLIDASPCTWSASSSSNNQPAAATTEPASLESVLSLNGQTVTTIATDKSIRYLTSLGNSKATWKTFSPALATIVSVTVVGGMVGDPVNGFTLFSADSAEVYRLSTDSVPVWKLTSPVPFSGKPKITQIAGDNINGVVVVSDEEVSNIARLGGVCGETWTMLSPKAPIKIDLITGDCLNGFVVYGEGQLYSLSVLKDAVWATLPTPNFHIFKIAGNPKDGVVALVGDGTIAIVAYCKDLLKAPWCLAYVPD